MHRRVNVKLKHNKLIKPSSCIGNLTPVLEWKPF